MTYVLDSVIFGHLKILSVPKAAENYAIGISLKCTIAKICTILNRIEVWLTDFSEIIAGVLQGIIILVP